MSSNPSSWLAAALLALLVACAPAAGTEPSQPVVALVNAPADDRIDEIAGALQQEVEGVPGCCRFSFTRTDPVRFQETHRDLFGSRAPGNTAALARNLGAEFAVMASAPTFERSVLAEDDAVRELEGEVQIQATVLDAETGRSLGTVNSLAFRRSWTADASASLPEPEEDPEMLMLVEEAVADIAPHLAALLGDVASAGNGP